MNKYFTLLLLLSFLNIFGQKASGEITYKVTRTFVDKGLNADVTATNQKINQQLFKIFFNKSYSNFTVVEQMTDENVDGFYNILAKIIVSNYDYYYDYSNNKLLELDRDGTLLEQELQILPWLITTDTKIIDKYQCYKATYTFEYLARDQKIKERTATAWFAPSLPYPYGPKNYFGLPGLILELNENDITFLVSKIEFSDVEIEIKLPKQKRIEKASFEKKIKNR